MGYMRHHAIIVTSWDDTKLKLAHIKALELFSTQVSIIVPSPINGYTSFFIAPDGSKEGWEDSNIGDRKRSEFIAYVENRDRYDFSSLSYCEVYYGDDEGNCQIVEHN